MDTNLGNIRSGEEIYTKLVEEYRRYLSRHSAS